MIIQCINCNKKFEVNSDLIPSTGRTIQCGSCGHIWFFKNVEQTMSTPHGQDDENELDIQSNKIKKKRQKKSNEDKKKNYEKKIDNIINKKNKSLVKYKKPVSFSFLKLLRYIFVLDRKSVV